MKAKDNVRRVLKLNPKNQGALYYAGLILLKEGKPEKAKRFFLRILNSTKYGERARLNIAEIKLTGEKRQFAINLEKKLVGEDYRDVLEMCQRELMQEPSNTDLIFTATYAATMAGMKDLANQYLSLFMSKNTNKAASAELKSFVQAWFSLGYNPETALNTLLEITDKRILRRPVIEQIKELIIELKDTEKFEKFINREKDKPGADLNRLDRELIAFYIDQGMNDKALKMINERPVDSIEDNIVYIQLLNHTEKEKKAMLVARRLLGTSKDDFRLYKAWTESFLAYYKRTGKVPTGLDEGGMKYLEMAKNVIHHIKFNKLVQLDPGFLLDLLRLAIVTNDKKNGLKITSQVVRIEFTKKLIPKLFDAIDELINTDKKAYAVLVMESAMNQLSENISVQIKAAQVYYINDRIAEAKAILETVLEQNPEQIKAFLLWVDCMVVLGKEAEAEKELLLRLDKPDINEIVKRQLDAKLAAIRLRGSSEVTSREYESGDK